MALQHIESLSRELRCSICLCVMSAPVARLPCCHYFCMPCAQQSVQEHGRCPNCNLRVKRRAISGDPTMDRVVSAFAELEAHKEELVRHLGGGPNPGGAAGTAGTAAAAATAGAVVGGGADGGSAALQEGGEAGPAPTGAGPSASFFETARESLGGAPSPAAAAADAAHGLRQAAAGCGEQSPDTVAAPQAGGICWLPGVDNEAYQSPSVSYAGPAQRRQAAQEARRLSLHSVQAQLDDGQRLQEHEQAEPGAAAAERAQQAADVRQDGKENAAGQPQQPQRQAELAADKQPGPGTAGGSGDRWQQRGPKTAAARRETSARQRRQAEGNQAITGFLRPGARGRDGAAQQAKQEAEQEAQWTQQHQPAAPGAAGAAPASAGGGEHAAGVAAGAELACAAAAAVSPGQSSDLRGVLAEVHAMAAAAAAGPADSSHGDDPSRAAAGAALLQRTPALAVQAAAPQTDKVPQLAAEVEAGAGAGPAEPAVEAEGKVPATKGTGGGSAGRKRSAAGGGRAGAAAGREDGGGAARGPGSGKRSRTAERRRQPTPAASDAGTPAPAALAAAAVAVSTGGAEGAGGSSRRIPTRLLPWNCFYCTFENQGAAHKCGMCEKKKKVLPASDLTAAAGATPAAPPAPAAAEAAGQPAADPTPAAAAAGQQGGGEQQQGGQATQQKRRGAASSRQRKMSSGAPGAAAGGSSGKRRKVGTPAAPAATAEASPAAVLPARAGPPHSWRSGSGGGGWVLVGSSLSARGRRQLEELAAAAGAKVARDWGKAVTHVVCGCAEGTAGRTFKYLMGVLSAKWVVREDWLAACLAQRGPEDERGFLVERDHGGGAGGPAAAISSHELGLPALLHGYEVFLAGDFSNGGEVAQLLSAAGARLLSRAPTAPPPRACAGPCTSFVLCEAAAGYGANPQGLAPGRDGGGGGGGGGAEQQTGGLAVPPAVAGAKWFQKAQDGGVPVVSHRWLLDSIGSFTPQPLAEYRLC